jgi:2-alkyl-3-oxoalkanoate reductase
VLTEADPLQPDDAPPSLRNVQTGYLYLEQAVTTIDWGEGLALRYGGFYGPGTGVSLAPDALMAAPIRKRRFPIVGDGGGVFSYVHVEDAASATAIAVERGRPGIYYVVDDEPAPAREWLPVLASVLDAKPPRRIPRWLARLAAGEAATAMMTEARALRTRRSSASSAGRRAMRAGGRASRTGSADAMTERSSTSPTTGSRRSWPTPVR